MTTGLPDRVVHDDVAAALAEDLGETGDVTTTAVVPAHAVARGRLVARAPGRIAGVEIGLEAFRQIDEAVRAEVTRPDGSDVQAGDTIAVVEGPARALLTGERVCLNLIGRLSGIATATQRLVAAVAGTRARITDTRKTTPGLRALEKYAVRIGGGVNHRFGLFDAVMIKDNHLAIAGSISTAVEAARRHVGHAVTIEVEVDSLAQVDEAVSSGADIILLDNMSPSELTEAVDRIGGAAITEASGGITLETVHAVAASGVDMISSGALTHSAPQLDVALDFD